MSRTLSQLVCRHIADVVTSEGDAEPRKITLVLVKGPLGGPGFEMDAS